jgi:hypothetical protein
METPNVTTVQKIASVAAGVPLFAKLLEVFGVYSLSQAQVSSLQDVITWMVPLAIGLIGSDAFLRGKRNDRAAVVEAAKAVAPVVSSEQEITTEELAENNTLPVEDPTARVAPIAPEEE